MVLLRLGRLKLWYNSFYRAAFAVPLLLSALVADEPAALFVFVSGMTLNYYYTSAINYISDMEEDALKPALGDKWDSMDDPANPLIDRGKVDKMVLTRNVIILYGVLSAVVLAWGYTAMPGTMFLIYAIHHSVLFAAGTLYSIGMRLKENPVGFLIASMLYWYPPLALYTLYPGTAHLPLYTAAIFLIGVQESMEHTLHHQRIDSGAGKRTLAVRFGTERVKTWARISGLLSYAAMAILAWALWPPLILLPITLFTAWAVTGLRYWRLYITGLYLYTAVMMYDLGHPTPYLLGVLLGIPAVTTLKEIPLLFRRGLYDPASIFGREAYHRLYSALHSIYHTLKKS